MLWQGDENEHGMEFKDEKEDDEEPAHKVIGEELKCGRVR